MAMLGMASNMCNRYFPQHYSTLDLNVVANGGSWTLKDDVNFSNSDHCYDRVSSLSSSADHQLEYNKEVLKQTMLKHEAIFKNQIYELHRLYRRQKELMIEIKKNSSVNDHSAMEKPHPDPVLSHVSSGYAPKRCSFPWMSTVCSETSVSATKNILAPSGFNEGKCKQVGPNLAPDEEKCMNPDLLESKCIKPRKILFDLELPADAYINCGEGESFEENDGKVPEVSPSYSCKAASQVVNNSTNSVLVSGESNSVSQEGTATPNSVARMINCITDLNKPVEVEVDSALGSDDFIGHANHKDISMGDSMDLYGNINSGCQAPSMKMTDGHTPSNLNSFPQGAYAGSVFPSSRLAHVPCKRTPESQNFSFLDKTSGKSWGEKAIYGMESSGRNLSLLENNNLPSVGIFDVESSQCVPHPDGTNYGTSSRRNSMDDSERNPIVVQALPCFTNSVKLAKSSKHSLTVQKELARGRVQHSTIRNSSEGARFLQGELSNSSLSESDTPEGSPVSVSLGHHSSLKHVKSPNPADAKSTKYVNLNVLPDSCSLDMAVLHDVDLGSGKLVFEDSGYEIGLKNKHSYCRDHIDLNLCMNEDESPPISTSPMNLEAPVSPDNKECSPIRGESDENQVEVPFQLSRHEDVDFQQELARSAAEAIVSISSTVAERCQDKTASKLSEVSFSESLYWFARIVVCSEAGDAENCSKRKRCESDEMDYFEAMTLKLTESGPEEYWHKSSDQKAETTSTIALPSQVKRGRRRGRQRKDFQNDVLPGIASLSRNEVTEDLQTIGGLIESARAQGSGLGRYGGRNGWGRGKTTESMTGASLKQKTSNGKLGFDRSLIGWGKITRRRRGRRHPATVSKPLHF